MNTIKLGILGFVIFAGSVAFAQEEKTEISKEQFKSVSVEKVSVKLDLSKAQVQELQGVKEVSKVETKKECTDPKHNHKYIGLKKTYKMKEQSLRPIPVKK